MCDKIGLNHYPLRSVLTGKKDYLSHLKQKPLKKDASIIILMNGISFLNWWQRLKDRLQTTNMKSLYFLSMIWSEQNVSHVSGYNLVT